jgi:hypothetical protein
VKSAIKQSVALFAARFVSDCRLAGSLDSNDRDFLKTHILQIVSKKES